MSAATIRRLLAGGAAVALAALLFAYGRSRETPPAAPSAAPSAAAAAAPGGVVEAPRRPWVPGAWYRYTLASDQVVTVRSREAGAQPSQPSRPMRFRIAGEWRVGICSESAGAVEARVAFSPSELSVDMGDDQPLAPEVRRALREGLSAPFFITLDRAGAVRFIHFEHSVDALVQGLLRSVVAASQVVLPAAASPAWEATEEDSSGRYVAGYRQLTPPLQIPLQIEKRKLRYTHLALSEGVQPLSAGTAVEVTARAALTLAAQDLWLESLEGEETVTLDAGQGMPMPTTHAQLRLRLVERGADPSLIGAFAARRAALFSLPMATAQLANDQDPRDQYRRALAGRTLDDFLKVLRAPPTEQQARDAALGDALQGLRALFLLEPAMAARVPEVLRARVDRLTASTLLGALGWATTPEALHTLAQIMADPRFSLEVRAGAVDNMSLAEAPTQEGITALWKLARGAEASLHEAAILSLGAAVMNLQKVDAGAAEGVVDDLARELVAAQAPAAQDRWLGALGNTRHPRALPSIKPFLGAASETLRSTATQALRFMPAPAADELLSEKLLTDHAFDVRRAAAFTAGFRPLGPLLPAIERALRTEPMAAVRQALLELLAAQVDTSAEARRLLTWSSQEDPDETVRRKAVAALARSRPP